MTIHTDWQRPSKACTHAARPADACTDKIIAPTLFVLGTALALATAVVLFGANVQAQTNQPAPSTTTVTAAAPVESKYTVAQIAQAFGFIDGNKDRKISRAEAAGFRGVARHFDEADANKDGALSRQEFENALSNNKGR
ncbi:hypothetical protein [Polaromonas sp.]|uniref:hypothetical protein n=1 Tax=Polaromonas sp. TaxID=1869339 RepID=UPI0037539C49